MSEAGGFESYIPGEGQSGAPEQLSEEAKQRFAAAAAAMQQIRREEKRSRKRDDRVARTIIQFLGSDQHAHLFLLISRLVARNCPSIFVLAVLSLIHQHCLDEVQEYLKDQQQKTARELVDENTALLAGGTLDAKANRLLIEWITRMQLILAMEGDRVLLTLMLDERNVDGTILQLTTFILQEFFALQGKQVAFAALQPLAGNILHTVFEPFLPGVRAVLAERAKEGRRDENEA